MIGGERFVGRLRWCQKIDAQLFGEVQNVATRMPVALGKLNGKLLQAGHPPGDESLPIALRHL